MTDSSTVVSLVRLVTGKLLSVHGRGLGERRIQGSVATIGIRGTDAFIEAEGDKTYFCLCCGEAEIVANADSQARGTVRSVHHQSPRSIYGKGAARQICSAPLKGSLPGIGGRRAESFLSS